MGKLRDYLPALKYGHKIYPEDLKGGNDIPPYVNEHWYVDVTNGADGDTGISEDHAVATIQEAIDRTNSYDYIHVLPGAYREELNTPACGGARGVTLAGHYNGIRSENRTMIYPDTASDHAIDVRISGWRITGFRIILSSGTGAGIRLQQNDVSEAAGTYNSPFTTIDHNLIAYHVYGIYSDDAPHSVFIVNNVFNANTTYAIYNDHTSTKAMADWEMYGNFFNSNTNDVYLKGTCKNNVIQDNNFNDASATKILYFEDASSVNNLVTRNAFCGTYGISTGYKAGGANNVWSGNYGVSGVTTGVPS